MGRHSANSVIRIRRKGGEWIDLTAAPRRDAAYRFSFSSNCVREFHEPRARDFMRLGTAFFLTDRYFRRSWVLGRRARELEIELGVEEPKCWKQIAPEIERWANFVTHDRWHVRFVRDTQRRIAPLRQPASYSVVALYSGGLDSFCGAAELAREGHRPIFVTHNPPGSTAVQQMLAPLRSKLGTSDEVPLVCFRLQAIPWTRSGKKSRFPERSRRTRALFFLSLAGAVAIEFGVPLVTMNENGVMAVNLPLVPGTTGATITRHAHPETLRLYRRILAAVWPRPDSQPNVVNLLANLTKQDAVSRLGRNAPFAANTLTCEYAGQQISVLRRHFARSGRAPLRECGLCVPCLVRRAALYNAGVREARSRYAFELSDRGPRIEQAPLWRIVEGNRSLMASFAQRMRNQTLSSFSEEFRVELALLPHDWTRACESVEKCYSLYQKFARQYLEFAARHE